jgi:hypothetical protein
MGILVASCGTASQDTVTSDSTAVVVDSAVVAQDTTSAVVADSTATK